YPAGPTDVYKLDISIHSSMTILNVAMTLKYATSQLQLCDENGGDVWGIKEMAYFPACDSWAEQAAGYVNGWNARNGTFNFNYNVKGGSIKPPAGGLMIGSIYFKKTGTLTSSAFSLDHSKPATYYNPRTKGDYPNTRSAADVAAVYYTGATSPYGDSMDTLYYAMDFIVNGAGVSTSYYHSGPSHPTSELSASDIKLTNAKRNFGDTNNVQPFPISKKANYQEDTTYYSPSNGTVFVSAYRKAGTSAWTYCYDLAGLLQGSYYFYSNKNIPLPQSLAPGFYDLKVCVAGNSNYHYTEGIELPSAFEVVGTATPTTTTEQDTTTTTSITTTEPPPTTTVVAPGGGRTSPPTTTTTPDTTVPTATTTAPETTTAPTTTAEPTTTEEPPESEAATKYIRLWCKTTKYVSNFRNWLLCVLCFGWIWMAF
ncbi:MAG: hypothetical protein FWC26_01245, partial [Fibromonadales bacterium]|nr:hypothetical protein [Fibromonadales bacterium]